MPTSPLNTLLPNLFDDTIFAHLLAPLSDALALGGRRPKQFHQLTMEAFITAGVHRHLTQHVSMRGHLQQLWSQCDTEALPVARSTFSDALNSSERTAYTRNIAHALYRQACEVLPDRLSGWGAHLQQRPVFAVDGTYQRVGTHHQQQDDDNRKGHCLLAVMDVRRALIVEAYVQPNKQAEIALLRDQYDAPDSLLRTAQALWVVDRAFIDAPFWDKLKRKHQATMLTRWKKNLTLSDPQNQPVDLANPVNQGVVLDQRITLTTSGVRWRKIHYCNPKGRFVDFLTNDLKTEPGVLAAAYARRWDIEKCFDQWKNDFSMGKAWGASVAALRQQLALASITQILVMMFLYERYGDEGLADKKSTARQQARFERRHEAQSETDRPQWVQLSYQWASKVSRQVLRFIRDHLTRKSPEALYEGRLRGLLEAYI